VFEDGFLKGAIWLSFVALLVYEDGFLKGAIWLS
jgi:hypothetical protein